MVRGKVTVFFYGAFVPVSDGCHARVCTLLDRLAAELTDVAVYSYDNHPDFPWTHRNIDAFRERWPDVELILESYSAYLRTLTRAKNLLVSLVPGAAETLLKFSIPRLSPQFSRLRSRSTTIVVNYTHGLSQLNGVAVKSCVVDTHDVNFVKWAKLSNESPVSAQSLRKLRGEIAALAPTGAVVAISPSEANFFRMMLTVDKVFYVPSWEDLPSEFSESGEIARDIDLVFVGSGYSMNARGLCDLLERDGRWLSRYSIVICGLVCRDPDLIAMVGRLPNVTLLGYVERLSEVYARSKAALSPVDGTGLKMKIVSALEAGLPVFASKQAFEGLPPGFEGSVFPITESSIAALLQSDQRLAEARAAARSYRASFTEVSQARAILDRLKADQERPNDD